MIPPLLIYYTVVIVMPRRNILKLPVGDKTKADIYFLLSVYYFP